VFVSRLFGEIFRNATFWAVTPLTALYKTGVRTAGSRRDGSGDDGARSGLAARPSDFQRVVFRARFQLDAVHRHRQHRVVTDAGCQLHILVGP